MTKKQNENELPADDNANRGQAIVYVAPDAISIAKSKYQIFPPLPPEEFAALKNSISQYGALIPRIVDEDGNVVEGWHRSCACKELSIPCPTIVRHFASEAEKFEIAASANGNRRHLNTQQKRTVIGTYLKADPEIADNFLAELLSVSKNTVADVRLELEATCQFDKLTMLRGKDGKMRPREMPKTKKPEAKAKPLADAEGKSGGATKPHKASKKLRRKAALSGMAATIAAGPPDDDEEDEEDESGEAEMPTTDWLYGTLSTIRSRLEHMVFEIKAIDWAKESVSPADYCEMLNDIILASNTLTEQLTTKANAEEAVVKAEDEATIQPKAETLPPRVGEGSEPVEQKAPTTLPPSQPTMADPATVTVGGQTYEVAWDGMWSFRRNDQSGWVACSREFAKLIEEQLAGDNK